MKLSLKEFFVQEAKGDQFSGPKFGQSSSSEKNRKADESLQLEYEDPTSSKHSHDDSKTAGPFSDQERMPHEEPNGDAQENSAEAWEEMRSSSGGDNDANGGDVKDFFGGAPFPKSSGGKSSRKSSQKMSEGGKGSGRKKGSKNKPKPDEYSDYKQPAVPIEVNDEDDETFLNNLANEPINAPKDDKTHVDDQGEVDWASLDDEDFLDKLSTGDAPPTTTSAPDPKMPKMADTISTKPYDSFDPEQYDFDTTAGQGPYKGPTSDDMTWDELRVAEPEEAAELEREFDENDLGMASFQKKGGRVYMTTGSGERFAYINRKTGWAPMDDGETPAGEF